jgi:serine/threonine protein kinase
MANVVTMASGGGGGPAMPDKFDPFGDRSSSSSSDDDDDDDDDDSMGMEDDDDDDDLQQEGGPHEVKQAYWIQRTIREAIYGRVLFAVILRRRPRALSGVDGADWEVTNQHCAVKEMSWQHIRKERDRLAEDPIKEVSAMQYIQKWYQQQKMVLLQQVQSAVNTSTDADVVEAFAAMRATNIMMPLDLLSDERNLYSIMPFCDGGELFERLDMNERFSEEEARYWMDQVLNVRGNTENDG